MALQLQDTSTAGKTAFLIAAGVDAARAARVANREDQFNAYLADIQREVDRLLTANKAASVSGYLNAIASTKEDMTDARKEAERQATLQALGGESEFLREVTRDAATLKSLDAYLGSEDKAKYNAFLDNAALVSTKFNPDQFKFEGVESAIGTTGATETSKTSTAPMTTDPAKFTGWMKVAYENALKTGKEPTLGANLSGSSVHQQNLQAVKDALKSAGWTSTGGTSEVADTTGGTTGGTSGTTSTTDRSAQIQSAIDFVNSQDLSADVKALYIATIQNWDPNLELNAENIIATFQKIKSETIDPRFQGLANLAIESVKTAQKSYADQRALELESEAASKSEAIRAAQGGLEASGLTFSGEGVRQLGTDIAAPVTFGGPSVEGLVPKQHRLISTSSEAAYQQNLKNLGLAAEEQLGSSGVSGIIPGYVPVGSVVGSLTEEKQAAEGSALGNILTQGISNVQDDVNTDYSQTSYA